MRVTFMYTCTDKKVGMVAILVKFVMKNSWLAVTNYTY